MFDKNILARLCMGRGFKFRMDVSLPLSVELPLQREQDQLLMDLVLKQGLSRPRRKAVNRVQLYLRVTSLADISTGDGRYIRPEFLSTIQLRRATIPTSVLTWPVENPSSKDFRIWVTTLNSITRNDFLLHNGISTTAGTQPTPYGPCPQTRHQKTLA